jgi:hypothetical protein
MVQAMLQAAAARGELRPDLNLEATTRLVHALLAAAGDSQLLPYLNDYFQVVAADAPPEHSLAALVELVLRGIENRGQGEAENAEKQSG